MTDNFSLDIILALLKQMEATLLGLGQLRGYVQKGPGQEILDRLIRDAETRLAEVKKKIIQ